MTTIASHLVDGTWEDSDSTVDVTNPADGSVVGQLAWGDAKTARRAADAAARAFVDWADLPPRRRAVLASPHASRPTTLPSAGLVTSTVLSPSSQVPSTRWLAMVVTGVLLGESDW